MANEGLTDAVPILLRAEHAVAGIAKARNDIAVTIELAVDGGGEDLHVGMIGIHMPDAFGRGQEADELDVLGPLVLEPRALSSSIRPVAGSQDCDRCRYGRRGPRA